MVEPFLNLGKTAIKLFPKWVIMKREYKNLHIKNVHGPACEFLCSLGEKCKQIWKSRINNIRKNEKLSKIKSIYLYLLADLEC